VPRFAFAGAAAFTGKFSTPARHGGHFSAVIMTLAVTSKCHGLPGRKVVLQSHFSCRSHGLHIYAFKFKLFRVLCPSPCAPAASVRLSLRSCSAIQDMAGPSPSGSPGRPVPPSTGAIYARHTTSLNALFVCLDSSSNRWHWQCLCLLVPCFDLPVSCLL
jgi:hypothetical protein